jgi:hypothetical protein
MLIGAGAAAVVGSVTPTAALANASEGTGKAKLVRWDLIQILGGVVVGGGTDDGLDVASGNTIEMTGSGQAEPAKGEAAGGGTFLVPGAGGVYTVTGFKSFTSAGGTLAGAGLTDGIGEIEETSGGVLSLNVHLVSLRGGGMGPPVLPGVVDGVLTVNCSLPGSAPGIDEGITLAVASLKFVQSGGNTLFHALRGKAD